MWARVLASICGPPGEAHQKRHSYEECPNRAERQDIDLLYTTAVNGAEICYWQVTTGCWGGC